jgi:uncharacterized integral membrane protein
MNSYQGQFGTFTITEEDRWSVKIYRSGLVLAAISFLCSSLLVFMQPTNLKVITPLFFLFALGLGISLATIHIYLKPLHQTLQVFWLIGTITGLIFCLKFPEPLAEFVYHTPLSLLGVGFIFAALTGIYFKEAFCFNRLETKILTLLVPSLLLGHLLGLLPPDVEKVLLGLWSVLFSIFALGKTFQAIPPDIGDKSVFEYLKQKQTVNNWL